MTTHLSHYSGSATITEAVGLMKKKLRDLIVEPGSEEDAYGILTEADIVYKVVAYGEDPQRIRVHEVMTKPCIVVNPDLSVEHVARLFARFHLRRAPVIKGKLLGVVSVTDIMRQAMWWQG
jgi:CBS domain-containing protein